MPIIRKGDWVRGFSTRYYLGEEVVIPFEGAVEGIDLDDAFVVGDDGEERSFNIHELELVYRD